MFGAFCINLVIGAQFAWGNFAPYIVGYYRGLGYDVFMNTFYLILPLMILTSTFVWPLGMYLSEKFGSRIVILIGGMIVVSSVMLASISTHTSSFFAYYAIGFGIGKGFLYPAPLLAGWSHLPGRKGLVSGIIVSGLGVGAFFFGILAQKLVNPDNIPP